MNTHFMLKLIYNTFATLQVDSTLQENLRFPKFSTEVHNKLVAGWAGCDSLTGSHL